MEEINKLYQFKGLYRSREWLCPAFVGVDQYGKISYLSQTSPSVEIQAEKVDGYALAGFPNAHSHAFQYAMAGLAEKCNPSYPADDFWAWREAMYSLALAIDPDQMEAIAEMLYAEMLRAGYTSLVEFHYLHYDQKGQLYANPAEMGLRLLRSAQKTGMELTIVPIFYQLGGFGKAPQEKQRRFISKDLDAYFQLVESTKKAADQFSFAKLGIGPHSLRAASPDLVKKLFSMASPRMPVHMHVSEQVKEVEDCLAHLRMRPVEWLLRNTKVNENIHLVHATHLAQNEVKELAASGANVVLCPTTEGNLGDGFFELSAYTAHKGNWCIGSDSHICLHPFEEIRLLDYGQRMRNRQRKAFMDEEQSSFGKYAYECIQANGQKALGQEPGEKISLGKALNAIVLDASHPLLSVTSTAHLLDTMIYATDAAMMLGTLMHGDWVVRNGKHLKIEEISKDFQKAMKNLAKR